MKKIYVFVFLIFTSLSAYTLESEINSNYEAIYNSVLCNNLLKLEKLLIKNESEINSIIKDGNHVFESVFIMDNCEAAELFFQYGLDISLRNNDGYTLKTLILRSNNKRLISFLNKYDK